MRTEQQSVSPVAVALSRAGARDLAAHELLAGVRFSAVRCGLERRGVDLGLVLFERDAAAAGCFTSNAVRSHAIDRDASLLPQGNIRGLVVNRGAANVLTGDEGRKDNVALAQLLAAAAGLPTDAVLTASLGPVGVPLALDLVESACPTLVAESRPAPDTFARILATGIFDQGSPSQDRADHHDAWVATTQIRLGEQTVRMLGLAGPSGLTCLFMDAALPPERLDELLRAAARTSVDALALDAVPGPRDMLLGFATGVAGALHAGHDEALLQGASEVLRTLVRQVAAHGRGATRLLEVEVTGAADDTIARAVAHRVCRDEAVRLGVFGAQACWTEVARAAGAAIADCGGTLASESLRIAVEDITLFEGRPSRSSRSGELTSSLKRPSVRWSIDLGQGSTRFVAYGCDLSFETVRAAAAEPDGEDEGRAGTGQRRFGMTGYSPRLKHQLLVEGLAYVRRFAGLKLFVHVAPALERGPTFIDDLALDLELCLDAGCKPLVVVPDAPSAEMLREHMLRAGRFAAEASGDPLALLNLLERGHLCILVRPDPAPHAIVELALKLGIGKLVALVGDEGLRDDHGLVQRLSPDTFLTGLERGRFEASDPEALVLARHAALRGVPALHIVDGRVPHVLVGELFTDEGVGTLVTRQALP